MNLTNPNTKCELYHDHNFTCGFEHEIAQQHTKYDSNAKPYTLLNSNTTLGAECISCTTYCQKLSMSFCNKLAIKHLFTLM